MERWKSQRLREKRMYFDLYPCFITWCFLFAGFEVNLSLQLLHSGIFFFGFGESRTLPLQGGGTWAHRCFNKKSGFTKNLHQHPAPSAPEGVLYTYFRFFGPKNFQSKTLKFFGPKYFVGVKLALNPDTLRFSCCQSVWSHSVLM